MNDEDVNKIGQSTLNTRKQARIPDKVIDNLDMETGDILVFLSDGNSVSLKKGEVEW